MNALFLEYPKCSTCQRAKKWLQEHEISFEDRHIVENPPTQEEMSAWILQSGLPIKRFFNTSGLVYKSLELKEKLPQMSESEQIALLCSNGMLIRRPLLITDKEVLVGFKEKEWQALLLDD